MNFLSHLVNRIGRFFVTVVRSSYDMELYRDIRHAPWTRALRYVVAFHATVVLLGALAAAPGLAHTVRDIERGIARLMPDGARVTVQAGVFSTTLPTPYRFGDGKPAFPVVVDAGYAGFAPPPEFGEEGGLYVGREAIFLADEGAWRTYPLKDSPDFSYGKEDVLEWMRAYALPVAFAGYVLLAVLFFALSLFSSAAFAVFMALAATALGRLSGIGMRYEQWLSVSFHAVTLPYLANLAFVAGGARVPFVFTVIYALFIVAVVVDERTSPVGPPEPPTPLPPPKVRKPSKRGGVESAK